MNENNELTKSANYNVVTVTLKEVLSQESLHTSEYDTHFSNTAFIQRSTLESTYHKTKCQSSQLQYNRS